jgi:hypothetical protein
MAYTTINKGSSYFNTVLWTGTGSAMSITGVGFKPDWVWYKGRSFAYNHGLFDAVRGTTNFLSSNQTNAEATVSGVTAFNSDGFSLGTDAGGVGSGNTFVAWNWLGANTTASNTSGSITSTVSANPTAGFSVVSYTGTGANATVGHGLGVAPKFIIIKNRSVGGTDWRVGHQSLTWNNEIFLSLTSATNVSSGAWNNTAPTSSVFSLGSGNYGNGSGNSIIAYCFAEVKGYSKFGSYTGNSSSDGTFVYTGFKPAFVMVKNTNYGPGTDWYIFDNKRNTYNVENLYLNPNLSAAEATGVDTDFLSNGFKLRHSSIAMNNSSYTYIYMAFAENPFVTSGGIPVTAR